MQLLELLAPVLLEYRPAPQAVQLLAPVLLEYRPAQQAVQPPNSLLALEGWYRPARQR